MTVYEFHRVYDDLRYQYHIYLITVIYNSTKNLLKCAALVLKYRLILEFISWSRFTVTVPFANLIICLCWYGRLSAVSQIPEGDSAGEGFLEIKPHPCLI